MKSYNLCFLIFLLFLMPPIDNAAQDSTVILGGRTYVFEGNQWFITDYNGEKFILAPTSFTVKLKENVPLIALENFCSARGIEIERVNKLGFIDLKLPVNSHFPTAFNNFQNYGILESITINGFAEPNLLPNDPGAGDQYYIFDWYSNGYPDINTANAWEEETGSTNPVIVAVIDQGVDFDNQDLIDNNLGWSFIPPIGPDPDPIDIAHHGTGMSGIIAAKTNNELAVSGIAGGWGNNPATVIMALRVGELLVYNINVIDDAIIFAADHGAKVINMSFSFAFNQPIAVASGYAYSQGCFLVASAGNTPGHSVMFPANHPLVLAVSGINKNWTFFPGNSGEEIDVTAPAQDIYTLLNNQPGGSNANWGYLGSGTSPSAAMVSGIVALLLSKNPNLIPKDLKNVINNTAVYDPRMENNPLKFGNGLVKADRCLNALNWANEFIPSYPKNLTVEAIPGTNPVLTWQTVQPAKQGDGYIDHYNIYRSIAPSKYKFTKVGEVEHNSLLRTHSWTDYSVTIVAGGAPYYFYRVTSSKGNKESITSNEVYVNANIGWKISGEEKNKFEYKLDQNHPNPFNPTTRINYGIKEASMVSLKVYDILGREVTTLVYEMQQPGNYTVDLNGKELASGIYIYKLQANNYVSTKKMLIVK